MLKMREIERFFFFILINFIFLTQIFIKFCYESLKGINLSLYLSRYICVSFSLSIYVSVSLSIYVSVSLSINLYIPLSLFSFVLSLSLVFGFCFPNQIALSKYFNQEKLGFMIWNEKWFSLKCNSVF